MAGLAAYLQGEIDRRGWSASQLASKAGIDKSALNYIFDHPDSIPRLKTLSGLAGALGISLSRLIVLCGFDPGSIEDLDVEQMAILRSVSDDYSTLIDQARRLSPEELRSVIAYMRGVQSQSQS